MSESSEVDQLYDVKNAFYLGNYQQCISEAQRLKLSGGAEKRLERDVFLYRAYIAQHKYAVVRDEIGPDSAPALQPLRALADYLSGRGDGALALLEKQLAETPRPASASLLLSAATVYLHEGNVEAALRTLHASAGGQSLSTGEQLECAALTLHAYLAMSRLDLAHKQLRVMQQLDDDATVTQLAHAWLNVAVGGDKLQDAYYIFQELMDKTSATPLLLNGQAVCYLGMCKYADADIVLQSALERDPRCAETLVNLVALSQRTGRTPEVAGRYLSQLREAHPAHPYVVQLRNKEAELDRLEQQYSLMVKV